MSELSPKVTKCYSLLSFSHCSLLTASKLICERNLAFVGQLTKRWSPVSFSKPSAVWEPAALGQLPWLRSCLFVSPCYMHQHNSRRVLPWLISPHLICFKSPLLRQDRNSVTDLASNKRAFVYLSVFGSALWIFFKKRSYFCSRCQKWIMRYLC